MINKLGRKSKVLFDSIDLDILNILKGLDNPIGVLDLGKKINLTHQNLKPHLEKLIKSDFIIAIVQKDKFPKNKINMTFNTEREEELIMFNKLMKNNRNDK